MNKTALAISNRLSLRSPQENSLEILSNLVDQLELTNGSDLASSLEKIKSLYPTCSSFERDFPSVCFSLATGVGKTRLMGAFIAYLYLEKNIKNFFVLAPNLTIYRKLIDDLSKPENPKYVFKGIAEFVTNQPIIITGDNYNQAQTESLFGETIRINVFNISKINSEVRGGREPRIKRLSECLGESYFNYLAALPDLVLLMDESHHYRADAGMNAISELKPILGLELTATPIDANGIKFKNVVFDYPLALALKDGFVKFPAIATKRYFDAIQYKDNSKELDILKLEDGIKIHEDTKVELEIYSKNTGNRLVKPFVLVVAKDTDHAKEIREIIESDNFFEGSYKDKVMEIHSNQRGEEKEENIQKLIDLEKPTNEIEIVIHVNMLKEGWDVTNLYTIIPLRASASVILTEQTIGRGLRLPYGIRTGVHKVDTLTIVAHDKFDAIIEEANKPNSLINRENIIDIDSIDFQEKKESITSSTTFLSDITGSTLDYAVEVKRVEPIAINDSQAIVIKTINCLNKTISNITQLTSEDSQKIAFDKITEEIENNPQQNIFKKDLIQQAKEEYQNIANSYIKNIIPIPRVILKQAQNITTGFDDFELDTSNLNYQIPSDEIIRKTLGTNENEIIIGTDSGYQRDLPENIIIKELKNNPQIDYDRDSDLIYKLVRSAINKLKEEKSDQDLQKTILYYKRAIAEFILSQMSLHFYITNSDCAEFEVYPFTKLEDHNFSKFSKDKIYNFKETINPISKIPSIIFGGFKKACHNLYKFDSKSEKDFTILLEEDMTVERWLRPASKQFSIYWNNNTNRYEPDFVVETKEIIYLIEIKNESDINDTDVQEKAKAAQKYCEIVSKFNMKNGSKEWKYKIIPHDSIKFNTDFKGLVD